MTIAVSPDEDSLLRSKADAVSTRSSIRGTKARRSRPAQSGAAPIDRMGVYEAWYSVCEERVGMQKGITLIDGGRGLQLSTSRITVHDLVPYFQDGCSYEEIIRWLPSLTHEEIRIVECYYRQHKDELDEYERRVRAHRAAQIRTQHLRFPEREGSRNERLAHLRQLLEQRRQEGNGERTRR
jgi:uncharacterized protein (DUF433 family)